LEVAKKLIEILGKKDQMDKLIQYVPDRKFNDLRYTINSGKLHQLGWKEEMPWEKGLKNTVDWYTKHSDRFGNIEDALVAHPRIGVAPGQGVSNEDGGLRSASLGDA
jgi:UDP-glucose 4,6-dehydratase